MPKLSRSSVVLNIDPDASPFPIEVDDDTPFRILILGDFTGRRNRRFHSPLAGRQPVMLDLDNFDEVLAAMKPALQLPAGDFRFREIDDFHPDHLHRLLKEEPQKPAAKAAVAPPADLLDNILSEATPTTLQPEDEGDLSAFIRRSMASELEARPDPAQLSAAALATATTAERMRATLHHPAFQALEAGWRSAWMLVQGLADDVKIYLFDATLPELLADPVKLENTLAASRDGWALIVGNYAFGDTAEDAAALTTLGRLAQHAGAPFLAEALPPGGEASSEEWQALRKSAVATSIGLTVPRFLLRLPYGKSTSPVESFQFEEMNGSVHEQYLWGNPAFCAAYLIGQAFRSEGWDLRPGTHRRIDSLPLHVYKEDGQSVNKPCAEILLSEKDANFLMERGYMALASLKDQDAVLLVRFQSIADPLAALAGRWTG